MQHLLFNYIDDHGTEVPLNVLVDKSNKVIYLTTASGQNSTDGDTLEDYNTVIYLVFATECNANAKDEININSMSALGGT